MAITFRKRRRVKLGKNAWLNVGKKGRFISITTKSGKHTTTYSATAYRSTYNYGNGLSRSDYTSKIPKTGKISKTGTSGYTSKTIKTATSDYVSKSVGKGRRRKAKVGRGDGSGTIILVGVMASSLLYQYPVIAVLAGIGCASWVAFRWWRKNNTPASETDYLFPLVTDEMPGLSEEGQSPEDPGGSTSEVQSPVQGKARPWFEVLEVSPDKPSLKEVKAARDNLARIFHSDRLNREKPDVVALADQKLAEVNLAYEEALKHCKRDQRVSRKTYKGNKTRLAEFVGFIDDVDIRNLAVLIEQAREQRKPVSHLLLIGTPAVSLAQTVARELGVNFRATDGPLITNGGDYDIAAFLTNLEERDVLFIDEIDRLNPAVLEVLSPAMKDFQLDLIIGEGQAARSVKIDLAPFTLIGAIAFEDQVSAEVREQFSFWVHLKS